MLYAEMTVDETHGAVCWTIVGTATLYVKTWGTTLAWTACTVEAGDWPSTLARSGAERTGAVVKIGAETTGISTGADETMKNAATKTINDFIFCYNLMLQLLNSYFDDAFYKIV